MSFFRLIQKIRSFFVETPSIWDRLSDRELAVIQEKSENNK